MSSGKPISIVLQQVDPAFKFVSTMFFDTLWYITCAYCKPGIGRIDSKVGQLGKYFTLIYTPNISSSDDHNGDLSLNVEGCPRSAIENIEFGFGSAAPVPEVLLRRGCLARRPSHDEVLSLLSLQKYPTSLIRPRKQLALSDLYTRGLAIRNRSRRLRSS